MRCETIGNVADVQTGPFGSQLHKEDYVDSGTPIVTVEHLGKRKMTTQNLPHVSNGDKARLSKYCLQEGDIVFSRVGSVDRCSYVSADEHDWMFSGRCLRVRCNPLKVYPLYLYYYFSSESTKQLVRNIAVGATMPSINTKLLSEIPFSYPALPEQKSIAAVLSVLDDKIELNNRINKNLEAQAQAIFKSWFVDFEPFRDGEFVDSELGPIPEGWRVEILGDLCDSVSVTKKTDKEKLVFLNTGDIVNGLFIHSNYTAVSEMPGQAKKSIQYGDILYSEIRPINRHFAYVNFNAIDFVVSTKLMVLRSVPAIRRRIYHYLTLQDTIDKLQLEAESRSGTFPQIRFENIKSLKIVLADTETEIEFCSMLECFYSIIDKNNEQNRILSALRDTLLPKLMSGEIRVPLEV